MVELFSAFLALVVDYLDERIFDKNISPDANRELWGRSRRREGLVGAFVEFFVLGILGC